jgi:hypothetical protein
MKNGQWKEDLLKKDGSLMRSVWAIRTPRSFEKIFVKQHPTQKPLGLLKKIGKYLSIILTNHLFSESGSDKKLCQKLKKQVKKKFVFYANKHKGRPP